MPHLPSRTYVGAVILLAAMTAALVLGSCARIPPLGSTTQPSTVGSLAGANILQPLTHPDPSLFADVGSGSVRNPFVRATGSDLLTGPGGGPEVFWAGAEYCPYCGAERWSLIMALSRFGSFSGLKLMTSGDAPEAYPDTATFTFADASYTSDRVYFSPVELQDRNEKTLQTPTAQQSQIMTKYNSNQYFGQNAGGIPFISVANQYITDGAGFTPGILNSLTWQQISGKLGNSKDPVTQDIVGNANWITAAICQTTSQSPASVCKTKPITDLESQL